MIHSHTQPFPPREATRRNLLVKPRWRDRVMRWSCLLPLTLVVFITLIDIPYMTMQIRQPQRTLSLAEQATAELNSFEQGNATRQAILGLSFALALIILFVPGSGIFNLLNRQKIMLLFLMYALLSVTWSPAPSISLRRWSLFLGTLLVAWCAMRITSAPHHMIRRLRWLFAVTLLLSMLFVLVKPDAAISAGAGTDGAWQGIHWHKNSLGSVTLLSIALWLPCLFSQGSRTDRLLAPLVLILAAFLAIKSNAKASQMSIAVMVGLWAAIKFPLQGKVKLLIGYIVAATACLWFLNVQRLPLNTLMMELLGRDTTLTGRIPLWHTLLDIFRQHPVLGVGYDAFWILPNFELLDIVLAAHRWQPLQAHNGYVDILNQLGLVGSMLFLCVLIQTVVRAMRLHFQQERSSMVFLLLFFAQLFINLAESNFCIGTSPIWITFLFIYVALAKHRLRPVQSQPLSGLERSPTAQMRSHPPLFPRLDMSGLNVASIET